MESLFVLKSVASSQLFEPVPDGLGRMFRGLKVQVRYEQDGQEKSLSFQYPYISNNINQIAAAVVHSVVSKDYSGLPADVSSIAIRS